MVGGLCNVGGVKLLVNWRNGLGLWAIRDGNQGFRRPSPKPQTPCISRPTTLSGQGPFDD